MGAVYHIQTFLGFLYFFLYLQGPLSCVQTDFCRITMSGKVSDLPTRFKRALFRQKKLDRINFRSGKSSTKCTRCPH